MVNSFKNKLKNKIVAMCNQESYVDVDGDEIPSIHVF